MIKGTENRIPADMQSQGSYMVKVGGRAGDDMTSQGSYMVRGTTGGNNVFDGMSSNQSSYMVRGGNAKFDGESSYQGSQMHRAMPDNDGQSSMMGFGEEANNFDDLTSQGTFFEKDEMRNGTEIEAKGIEEGDKKSMVSESKFEKENEE